MQTPRFATTRYLAKMCLLVACQATPLAAELHLAAPVTDNMVLQQDYEISCIQAAKTSST